MELDPAWKLRDLLFKSMHHFEISQVCLQQYKTPPGLQNIEIILNTIDKSHGFEILRDFSIICLSEYLHGSQDMLETATWRVNASSPGKFQFLNALFGTPKVWSSALFTSVLYLIAWQHFPYYWSFVRGSDFRHHDVHLMSCGIKWTGVSQKILQNIQSQHHAALKTCSELDPFSVYGWSKSQPMREDVT